VDGLTFGNVSLVDKKYSDSVQRKLFAERLQEKLLATPGVQSAAISWFPPVRTIPVTSSFAVEGRPEPPNGHEPNCFNNAVTPGYFKTLGMSLVTGRDFDAADDTNRPPVAIINETMARTFWPGESAIGKRFGSPGNWQEIVGVVTEVPIPEHKNFDGKVFICSVLALIPGASC
jgi:putative ABC transport system permease protein